MALSSEQWQAIKADYEIGGLSIRATADKHGVSKSALAKRAKDEGWVQGKMDSVHQQKVNAIMALSEAVEKSGQMSNLERTVFDNRVHNDVVFRLQNDERMERVALMAMRLLEQIEHPSELTHVMRILTMQREARLGKTVAVAVKPPDEEITVIERRVVDVKPQS